MRAPFIDPDSCGGVVAMLDANARASTSADHNGDDALRTSATCDLDHLHPVVVAVNDRLHALTGIPREYGEPLQGQRYDVVEEFKAHTDYFDPDGADWDTYCAIPGQRKIGRAHV